MKFKDKLMAGLSESDAEIVVEMFHASMKMRTLLVQRMNQDVADTFGALVGKENIPPDWIELDTEAWTNRAEEVCFGPEKEE